MFELPLAVFLIPFGLFLFVFALYSTFNVYHLLRFGIHGMHAYVLTFIFTAGAIILGVLSIDLLLTFDWTTSVFSATNLAPLPASDYGLPL